MSLCSDVVGMKTSLLFWWLCARPSSKVSCFFSANTNWCCGNIVSSPHCPPGGHEASLPPPVAAQAGPDWSPFSSDSSFIRIPFTFSLKEEFLFLLCLVWMRPGRCWLTVLFVCLGGCCCLLFHRGVWRCCWSTSRRCRSQTVETGEILFISLVHCFLKFESHLFLCCRYRDKSSGGSVQHHVCEYLSFIYTLLSLGRHLRTHAKHLVEI